MKQRGVVSKPAKQIEDGLGTGTGVPDIVPSLDSNLKKYATSTF